MVLKKIAALCKSAGMILILEDPQRLCQWLGTEKAHYPLDGYPEVDDQTVFKLLDIAEKDREKYQVYHRRINETALYADNGVSEALIEQARMNITYGGTVLTPALDRKGGLNFYDAGYLAPLKDRINSIDLYIRTDYLGKPVIAAKEGLLLSGLFLPEHIEKEDLFEKLAEIGNRLRGTPEVDPETGEVVEE